MTLSKLYDMGLISDTTEIIVRRKNFSIFAKGKWYQDQILNLLDMQLDSFSWEKGNGVNCIYADLEGDNDGI